MRRPIVEENEGRLSAEAVAQDMERRPVEEKMVKVLVKAGLLLDLQKEDK